MTHKEFKKKNFENYKFKVLNCLIHNSEISIETQAQINNCKNKSSIVDFIEKNLNKDQITILKNNKIEPFFKNNNYIKILYNPMGNKK
ncbi:hypothetical protein VSO93_17065 [Myroides odoratimimus]|nr:hypothetical protein [Myroides odoratimimus]MEC4151946.1 hypothetical protein [Myroides odoratimimus]